MSVEIYRYFELTYTTHQMKHTETYSERCGAIDTSDDDSGKGNGQYEGPGSDSFGDNMLLSSFV